LANNNTMKVFLISILIFFTACNYHAKPNSALYDQLGKAEGIKIIVSKTIELSHNDKRIAFLFEETDDVEFARQLEDQICFLSNGPCEYDGLDMLEAHSGMEITEAEFDIFVSLFIDAMEFANVPHPARNKLLALLAPMRGDIIYQ